MLRSLLARLDDELVICELGCWAAYFGDPLDPADKDRVLLACRRLTAIREAAIARL